MTLFASNTRFFVSRRLFAWPCWIAATAIGLTSGCAITPTAGRFIPIHPSEGARWISAETMDSYGCDALALVCNTDGGRLSARRCRCDWAR